MKTEIDTKRGYVVMALTLLLLAMLTQVQAQPKREFRGAWIQCVNGQFLGMGTATMQRTLSYQLDELYKDGVNAIIFQVRPECDALYPSELEPWSRFLTGQQGKAPSPYWDPLQWMIDQCHARGMELHAWINPYRAKTKTTTLLATNHVGIQHPERCFSYDDMLILDPGLPENRDYICQIALDIVRRYDVDGIHMDDYFYPYPVAGLSIPDNNTFSRYHSGFKDRADWRRNNVNLFIKQFYKVIHNEKPWVKVGISPFGIYRNKRSANIGSNTNGLQNYDDLYADVLLWVNEGWLDYVVPQIYWEIGNKAADYETLIRWWNQYSGSRHLYIGEDVERTVKAKDLRDGRQNQQAAKQQLHNQLTNVKGSVLWYAKAVVDNVGNYGTVLRNSYWRTPALQPQMDYVDKTAPRKPRKMAAVWTDDGYKLFWTAPRLWWSKKWKREARQYVVYRFAEGEEINLDDPRKIVAITTNNYCSLPYGQGTTNYIYVVTALNRMQNEGKPAKKKVKL